MLPIRCPLQISEECGVVGTRDGDELTFRRHSSDDVSIHRSLFEFNTEFRGLAACLIGAFEELRILWESRIGHRLEIKRDDGRFLFLHPWLNFRVFGTVFLRRTGFAFAADRTEEARK